MRAWMIAFIVYLSELILQKKFIVRTYIFSFLLFYKENL